MSSPLSSDLRSRVLNTVEEGSSRRQAAVRFKVSPSSAICWRKCLKEEGRVEAKRLGGDRRSHHVEAHADAILKHYEERPTIFLSELRAVLAERVIATVWPKAVPVPAPILPVLALNGALSTNEA